MSATPHSLVRPRLRTLTAVVASLLLIGCGQRGDGAGDGALDGGTCALDEQLAWVDAGMRDYYLFYDQVPSPRLSDFDSEDQLIKALRVPPDSFSYVGDAATTAAYFEQGEDFGYGWRLDRLEDGALVVTLVEPRSPLASAGVQRGDIIRTIEGVDERTISSNARYDELLGTGDDVRTIVLGVEDADGVRRDVSVTRGVYPVDAVLDVDVRQVAGTSVGYLSFLTFTETSRAELDDAFAQLAAANVDELILDLRFNGGGRIDVANELASRVVGAAASQADFVRYRVNDKEARLYAPGALEERFKSLSNALDLPRVYVLSSARTCSASEMVINGLSPLLDVVTIGDTTCGKPFGFTGNERCGKVMYAVEYEFVNDAGVGGYVDGLAPTCAVADDTRFALGNAQEPLLSAALQHIETATCPAPPNLASMPSAKRRSGGTGWTAPNPVDPAASDVPPR